MDRPGCPNLALRLTAIRAGSCPVRHVTNVPTILERTSHGKRHQLFLILGQESLRPAQGTVSEPA